MLWFQLELLLLLRIKSLLIYQNLLMVLKHIHSTYQGYYSDSAIILHNPINKKCNYYLNIYNWNNVPRILHINYLKNYNKSLCDNLIHSYYSLYLDDMIYYKLYKYYYFRMQNNLFYKANIIMLSFLNNDLLYMVYAHNFRFNCWIHSLNYRPYMFNYYYSNSNYRYNLNIKDFPHQNTVHFHILLHIIKLSYWIYNPNNILNNHQNRYIKRNNPYRVNTYLKICRYKYLINNHTLKRNCRIHKIVGIQNKFSCQNK